MVAVELRTRPVLGFLKLLLVFLLVDCAHAGPYDPPGGYYAGATGTGATLKSQLTSAMAAGHVQRSYGDFRHSAAITDADPDQPGNILLVYDRSSVPGEWSTNPLVWNREHVWPQANQPGSASNSTRGNLGDPHALRPSDPQINSNRGSDPFGFENTTGSHRSVGSYYFPGDADKGDVARSLFYSDTRYASSGLSLVDGFPSGNEMGDLSSLLAWHYLDPPDEFEQRRNHAIYSQAMNPQYYTNNRNAYVDRPEFAWSVYADQENDSQLFVGNGPDAIGSSSVEVDLGRVIVGAPVPVPESVTLHKSGVDGTYYEVQTSGAATSAVTGRHNAFAINTSGSDSNTWEVGLDTTTSSAGLRTGTVRIDNLDVTTGGGAGQGANDADDTIHVNLEVLDHSNGSFAASEDTDFLEIDFGSIDAGSTDPTFQFDIFNLMASSGYTADLELDTHLSMGDTDILTTDVGAFNGGSALSAGDSYSFTATMDTTQPGDFSAMYFFGLSDEDLPGAEDGQPLVLSLAGSVVGPGGPGDFDVDGDVDGRDFLVWQRGGSPDPHSSEDLIAWKVHFGSNGYDASLHSIPEPASILLLGCAVVPLVLRRGS